MLGFKHAFTLPNQSADRSVTTDKKQLLVVLCMLHLHHWSMTKENASSAVYATKRMGRRVDACIEENRKNSRVTYKPLGGSGIAQAQFSSSSHAVREKGLTQ